MDPRLGPSILRQLNVLREAARQAGLSDDDSDGNDSSIDLRPPAPPTSAPGEQTLQRLLSKSPVPWDDVLTRLESHPSEAALYGYHNQSPLQRCLMEEDPPVPLSVVKALIASHPKSTSDVDDEGRSALYYAAYYKRDGDIVKAILESCPDMVKKATAVGTMPLHVAYTEDAAKLLVEAYVDVIKMRDGDGEIPLHGAASWGDAGAVKVLLDAGRRCFVGGMSGASGALVQDRRDKTPLDRACELIVATSERVDQDLAWGAGRGGGLRQSFIYRRMPMDGTTALQELDGEAMDTWRKLELLVREASAAVVADTVLGMNGKQPWKRRGDAETLPIRDAIAGTNNIPILHAAVASCLPPEVIWHAANIYQEQVMQPDMRGRQPLHYAAQSIGRRRANDESCESFVSSSSSSEVINILLHSEIFGSQEPAGVADVDGRLPLHLAVEAGGEYDEGVEALVRACPRALEERDESTRLFPFALAAATFANRSSSGTGRVLEQGQKLECSDNDDTGDSKQINMPCGDQEVGNQLQSSSIDTIFRLLREAPSVLAASCNNSK